MGEEDDSDALLDEDDADADADGDVEIAETFERNLRLDAWDASDQDKELTSAFYATDITDSLFEQESIVDLAPVGDYMAQQDNLRVRMRLILLDWILDVHRKFELRTPTLYLCVNLLDRFLARKQVLCFSLLFLFLFVVCCVSANRYIYVLSDFDINI